MDYVCGWDGGGTKTRICCQTPEGCILSKATFGPLNLNGNAPETIRTTIQNALHKMDSLPGGLNGCRSLAIGMAGFSNSDARQLIQDEVIACGYKGPLLLTSDVEIALECAIHGDVGGILIAGTGSICLTKDACGNQYRVGGYGHIIDDCGSGYAIGRDILSSIIRAADGRLPHTCLTEQVYQFLCINDTADLIRWVYSDTTDKSKIASLAALLNDAISQKDAAALSIAERAGNDLTQMVLTAWHKSGLTRGKLALSGSILEHVDCIRSHVLSHCLNIYPEMEVISPVHSPDEGAALLAAKHWQKKQNGNGHPIE